jgi:hypothetical protein
VNQALICALWLDILPGLLHTLPVDIVVLVDRSPLTICNVACCRVLFLNMKVCHCLHWHPFARSLSVFNKKSLQVRNWLDPMQNLVCSQVYMSTVDLEKSPSRFCDTNCLVCYNPSIFRLIHTKPWSQHQSCTGLSVNLPCLIPGLEFFLEVNYRLS